MNDFESLRKIFIPLQGFVIFLGYLILINVYYCGLRHYKKNDVWRNRIRSLLLLIPYGRFIEKWSNSRSDAERKKKN